MSLNRNIALAILWAAFFSSPATLSQAQDAPSGLDTGESEYKPLIERPPPSWLHNEKALGSVRRLTGACFSSCHGREQLNQHPNTPNIAGQNYNYILKQLETFNQNNLDEEPGASHRWDAWERSSVTMNSVTDKVDEKMYGYVADLISRMPCDQEKDTSAAQPLPPQPPSLMRCVSCHGEDGQSTFDNIPVLAGQSYTYLRRQLILIRDSQRHEAKDSNVGWRSHPTMEPIMKLLTILDINALAKYYSQLDCRGGVAAQQH